MDNDNKENKVNNEITSIADMKADKTITARKRDGENLPAMTPAEFARLVREESTAHLKEKA